MKTNFCFICDFNSIIVQEWLCEAWTKRYFSRAKTLVGSKSSFNIADTEQVADILSSYNSKLDSLNKYGVDNSSLPLMTKFSQIKTIIRLFE